MAQTSRVIRFPVADVKRQKKKKKKFLWSLFVLALVLVYFGYTIAVQAVQLHEVRQQEKILTDKLKVLSADVKALQREIELLGTDEYIEKLARERLGLIRPQDSFLIPVYLEPRP